MKTQILHVYVSVYVQYQVYVYYAAMPMNTWIAIMNLRERASESA